MKQSSTSPATNSAISGAGLTGNMAKQRFASKGEKVRGSHGNLGGLINKW